MPFIIPINDEEKIVWAENFKLKFSEVGADYDFNADEVAKVEAACDTVIFAARLARAAKAFSKSCTKYRNAVNCGKSGEHFGVPVFLMPDAPAVFSPPNAVGFLNKVIKRLKARDNYSAAVGHTLRIEASKSGFLKDDAKPKGKTKSLMNSVVRIDWTKGKAHGVIVESQRADETVWTELGRDMYSPFIDTRPPLEAGKPETRRYRLRYLFNDEPIGDWSNILTAITIP